jgi:hypothetical protein
MKRLILVLALILSLAFAAPAAGASIEITDFDGGAFLENGDPADLAGSRPHTASTTITLASAVGAGGQSLPLENLKDAIVDLPPGLVGNPLAVTSCTPAEFTNDRRGCPDESQVGVIIVDQILPGGSHAFPMAPVYNLKAPFGTAALLGFYFNAVPVTISAGIRSDGDYGVTAVGANTQESILVAGVEVEVWGVPADLSHDTLRGTCISPDTQAPTGASCPSADVADPKAFFTLPTSCEGVGPNESIKTDLSVVGWQGGTDSASFLSHDNAVPTPNPIGISDCEALEFTPSLRARPTTDVADSASGLDVDLSIPQNEDCEPGPPVVCERATAHLRDTTVTLPEGIAINPAGANGLDGCSPSGIGLRSDPGETPVRYTGDPADCPDASKVGNVEVETPLLDHPLKGSVYVAEPYDNPFDSLLAIYIAIDDPESGVVVTLAGEAKLDRKTGRITSTFEDNPQLPFEDFHLEFKSGAHAPLVTPPTCGTHTTRSELSSWAGQNVTSNDSWRISKGPDLSCARSDSSVPHLPSFEAGTVSPIAGIHSPFVLNLRRPDGSQRFGSLTVSPPPGLTATLAATPPCPEALLAAAERRDGKAEERDPSCPLASKVGTVHAQAGAGPSPYNAPGTAYLAGPYKGAPLSLAIVTPAVAGPFDLGTVVIRTALHVNPTTAQITAISDPIPSMLEGIPLNVRSASVRLDKPGFALNPTSCNEMLFGGQLTSTEGAVAQLIERFQLAECGRLGFKPRVNLRLFGGIKRAKYQGVRAVVRPRPGDANISRTVVRFPRSAFVAQEHIRTICTRVQFAADACPKGSIYGKAIAQSPLLSYPLEGNVYLRSSNNELPDAVADLRGPAWQPLRVEVAIRNDSVKGALRNTVQVVPDAPVSYFRLQLFGGKKGLIVNSRNICVGDNRATVVLGAHNGRRTVLKPNALNPKCKKAKRKGKAKRKRAGAKRHAG